MIHREAYLEMSHKCYAKCVMCDMPKQNIQPVPLDTVKERLLKLNDAGFRQVRITGKEPMLYPWFRQVVNFMHDYGMLADMTTTLLTPDLHAINYITGFHKLRVSLFALYDQHKAFYGVDLADRHIRNIKYLSAVYTGTINFNYTLAEADGQKNWSMKSLMNIERFVEETGIDNYCFNIFPEFKYKEGLDSKMRDDVSYFVSKLRSSKIKHDYFDGTPKHRTTCDVMQHRLFVKHDGSIYPCCMTAGEVGQPTLTHAYLGNIDNRPLHDIMDKKLTELDNPICSNCTQKYYNLMR